jgi:hypothetical protein
MVFVLAGTRLVYERSTLMELRNSPLSRTPPSLNMPMPDRMNKDIKNPPKIRPTKKQPERPKNGNVKGAFFLFIYMLRLCPGC